MAEKQEILSLRIAEQLLKRHKTEIWELKNSAKCMARKMLKKLQEKPVPTEFSDLFKGKEYLQATIDGEVWYIAPRESSYHGHKAFRTLDEAKKYVAKDEFNSSNLDNIVDKQYKPLEKKLEKLADEVLLAESKDRKAKYEKFKAALETAQNFVENEATNAYNALVTGKIKPENNC